jgi:pyruvate dehydrogenase E1 component
VTSFSELAREGLDCERHRMLNPEEEPRLSWVERQLALREGPCVAATDYVHAYAEQIRPFLKRTYRVLGTDGFGRSDTRERLRSHFEVDRAHVCVAALSALADDGLLGREVVAEAIRKYGIDTERPNPRTL